MTDIHYRYGKYNLMIFLPKSLYQRLQRITTSGSYIPSLDGLRFFAIAWVTLYHLHGSFTKKAPEAILIDSDSWFYTVMVHGRQGVPLFFALSGFFICLPFTRQFILKREGQVNLKDYYIRRLLRIAPPYWIAVLVLSFMYVALDKYSASYLIPHIGASLAFVYTFVFQEVNILNTAFWALEAEIQFYLVAPLLVYLYFTMPRIVRRMAVLVLIGILPFIQAGFDGAITFTLLNYIQYFLAGFMICDVYISEEHKYFRNAWFLPLVMLPLILFTRYDDSLVERIFYPIFIIILYLTVLFNPLWDKVFSWKPIVAIGGISYTIYLIHFPIIGFFGTYTMPIEVTGNYYFAFFIQCVLLLPIVLLLSFIFYLVAEKPFMRVRPYGRGSIARGDKAVGPDVMDVSK